MRRHAFTNGKIVTDQGVLADAAIMVDQGRICALAPAAGITDAIDLGGGWLLPGFVDVQVNGGGGVLFNDETNVAGLRRISAAHARFGTTAFLPTLISETPAHIAAALDAVDSAIDQGVPGVIGAHIEGPVLNPARKGIHDERKFQPLDRPLIALLARPRRGKLLVTLAPERADPASVRALLDAGVIVSIGHSEIDYDGAIAAFDLGVTGVTHLFNAMPPMTQRAPGLVGAALSDARPWCGLIVDGVHISPVILRLALRLRPFDRMMLVTDAMPSVGANVSRFMLQGKPIDLIDGRLVHADGTLAGAHLDMAAALRRSVADLGISVAQAAAMASTHPSAFLGLSAERGGLEVGKYADWVQLDAGLSPVKTWIAGEVAA